MVAVFALIFGSYLATMVSDVRVSELLVGTFDNADQAHHQASLPGMPPHTTLSITATAQPEWTLWRVGVDAEPGSVLEQTWAMHEEHQKGHDSLVPYYQLKQDDAPDASAFDPAKWLSLEACALHGSFRPKHMQGFSEGEQCVAVTMGVGARRALLPVAFDTDGETLKVDLNIRGQRASIVAHRRSD